MNLIWSKLSRNQKGKFGESFAKTVFMMYDFEVFTSEVDENGIDFIAKSPNNKFIKVQVKSVQNNNYTFITESKFVDDLYICLVTYEDNNFPHLYLFSKENWLKNAPNILKMNDFPNSKQKEFGFHLSKKNENILQSFEINNVIKNLL